LEVERPLSRTLLHPTAYARLGARVAGTAFFENSIALAALPARHRVCFDLACSSSTSRQCPWRSTALYVTGLNSALALPVASDHALSDLKGTNNSLLISNINTHALSQK
jgi:hypothetical protein